MRDEEQMLQLRQYNSLSLQTSIDPQELSRLLSASLNPGALLYLPLIPANTIHIPSFPLSLILHSIPHPQSTSGISG